MVFQKGNKLGRKFQKDDMHPNWKGDKVKYDALHFWIKKNLRRPELCEYCKQPKKLDLANVTGIYTRDFSNWKFLCRSCHMKFDREKVSKEIKSHWAKKAAESISSEKRREILMKAWDTRRRNQLTS